MAVHATSRFSPTLAELSQKLGQPVPESNLVSDAKSRSPHCLQR